MDATQTQNELIRADEIASRLRYSVRTVNAWMRQGKLSGTRIGRHWFATAAAFRALVDAGKPSVATTAKAQDLDEQKQRAAAANQRRLEARAMNAKRNGPR